MEDPFDGLTTRSGGFAQTLEADGSTWRLLSELSILDAASEAAHHFGVHEADDQYRISTQKLRYPDGMTAEDDGLAHEGGYCEFQLSGATPGADLLILRRSDFRSGDYRAELHIDGEPLPKPLVVKGSDRRYRWRNWAYLIPGEQVESTEPVIRQVVLTPDQPINMFRFWFYQRQPTPASPSPTADESDESDEASLFGIELDRELTPDPTEESHQPADPTPVPRQETPVPDDSIEWRAPAPFDPDSASQTRSEVAVLDEQTAVPETGIASEPTHASPPTQVAVPEQAQAVKPRPASPWDTLDSARLAAVRRHLVLPQSALESAICELMAGRHLALCGPPASGRTQLATALAQIFGKRLIVASGADAPAKIAHLSARDGGWLLVDAGSLPPPLCIPTASEDVRVIARISTPDSLPPHQARYFGVVTLDGPSDTDAERTHLEGRVPGVPRDLADALFRFVWLGRAFTPIGTGSVETALRLLAVSVGAPMSDGARLAQALRGIVTVLPGQIDPARAALATWAVGGDLGGAIRHGLDRLGSRRAVRVLDALTADPVDCAPCDVASRLTRAVARAPDSPALHTLADALLG